MLPQSIMIHTPAFHFQNHPHLSVCSPAYLYPTSETHDVCYSLNRTIDAVSVCFEMFTFKVGENGEEKENNRTHKASRKAVAVAAASS